MDFSKVSVNEMAAMYNDSSKQERSEMTLTVYERLHSSVIKFIKLQYRNAIGRYFDGLITACYLGVIVGMKDYAGDDNDLMAWFEPFMKKECDNFLKWSKEHASLATT